MAKSKNGGTRAFIRGRIGSDVYSVGKDGMGKRQQVVRSLAEQVSNPRSQSQMFGRMIMSTVVQAVSALQPIIDHSFDGIAKGQPSISEFIRQNYALVKADATAHPATNNQFALNKYQQKGLLQGAYLVAKGSAVVPAALKTDSSLGFFVDGATQATTVGQFKALWGLNDKEFITLIGQKVNTQGALEGAKFVRISFKFTVADATVITSEVLNAAATFEGSVTASWVVDDEGAYLSAGMNLSNAAVIVSKVENGAYVHNTAYMKPGNIAYNPADEVLPTYPVGSQLFLNGGNI